MDSNINLDVTEWQWSTDSFHVEMADLGISEFEGKLKEKMNIDKQSAGFLKTATQIIKNEDMLKLKSYDTIPLVLKTKFLITECVILDPKNNEPLVTDRLQDFIGSCDVCDYQYDGFKKATEMDVLPKEVMTVNKEVKEFVKEALKSGFELPNEFKKLEKVQEGVEKFRVNLIDTGMNLVDEPAHCFDIPLSIEMEKDTDVGLVEEEIAELCDPEQELSMFESDVHDGLRRLKKMNDYIFKLREEDPKEFPLEFDVEKWNTDIPDEFSPLESDTRPLESHLIEEELEKGLEYRLAPPFMDSAPPYNESKNSLEYANVKVPKKLKIPNEKEDPLLYFQFIASKFKERDLTDESIKAQQLQIFEEATDTLVKLVTASEYIITDGECDAIIADCIEEFNREEEKENPTPQPDELKITLRSKFRKSTNQEPTESVRRSTKPNPEPTNRSYHIPELDDDSDTSMTSLFGKSHFAAHKTNNDQTAMNFEDTLAVNKMATTVLSMNQTTIESRPTAKRSIDDELEELISKRKKKAKVGRAIPTVRVPLLEYLKGEQTTEVLSTARRSEEQQEPSMVEDNNFQRETQNHFNSSISDATGTIGFNLTYININQEYLRFLDDHCKGLKVLEFEMDENDADFIINSKTAILIIQAKSLEQYNLDGDLIIGERLLRVQRKYQTSYVIISTSSTYTRYETLTNFQIAMIQLGMKPIITTDSVLNICEYISKLSSEYSRKDLQIEDIETIESDSRIEILVSCGVNQFAALEMLQKRSLLDIISMSFEEWRKEFPFLGSATELGMERLFSLEWSIS
ncbi:hypothetical protein WICPIJ_006608 [Wickerhamomyces pijperi]|uniref:Uncharacterized protein n=1 Tax=Wickerhamomyces pijperi TaxID=599730 RepID=A0A9P8Q3F6_WICPI|nr:hypothetical protein WICPIJ_006608 [Wickerhamomyces pijperi]